MGLEHTHSLLGFLNNPQEGIKTIHIAGTNGKGSTAATIYSILRECGYKVGLYTSPHLIKFNERIRINGRFITDEEIISFMRYAQPSINEIKSTFSSAFSCSLNYTESLCTRYTCFILYTFY